MRLNQALPAIFLFLGTLLGLYWVFGPMLWQPQEYLLSGAGDGQKAYYALEYWLRYVPEGVQHPGMHHPYGNHLLYLDQNPLLSWMLRQLPGSENLAQYTLGIVHVSIMLSFFCCAGLMYLILRRTSLPRYYAVVASLLITFFSPQLMRLTGHYALSYLFFVPLMWYCLIRMLEGKKPWAFLMAWTMSLLSFTFVHPYYFLIGFAFLIASLGMYAWQDWEIFRARLPFFLTAIGFSILPIICLNTWIAFTYQGAEDAVRYPYGFLDYIAGFETIFIPPRYSPVWEQLNALIRIRRIGLEGYAYVGIVGLLVLTITLGRMVRLLRSKQRKRLLRPVLPLSLRPFIWAATLLLIPAMAYPFQLFPEWADYLQAVRQFRSLGRIAWIFYFVFMVYAVNDLYRRFRTARIHSSVIWRKRLAWLWLMVPLGLWGYEMHILVQHQRRSILANPVEKFPERNLDFQAFLAENGYQASDFQAILALPFFHHGSEKFFLHHWRSTRYAMSLSLDTGLPMFNNVSARVPLSQARNAIQLVSHPVLDRELHATLSDPRPILLLVAENDAYRPGAQHLIQQSSLLGEIGNLQDAAGTGSMQLRLLNSASLEADRDSLWQYARDSLALALSSEPYIMLPEGNGVVLDSYGDAPFNMGIQAQKTGRHKAWLTLFDGPLPGAQDQQPYVVSVWAKVDRESDYLPLLQVRVLEGEQVVLQARKRGMESWDIWRDWVRIEMEFVLPKAHQVVRVETQGRHLCIDNLLIQPKGSQVFAWAQEDGRFFWNNYPILPPE